MDVRVGLWRKLSAEELMLLNCGVGKDLRVPWTARRSNQSILKEISPGFSLEGLMLKLKLQYFDHLMRRFDSLEKTLMLGGIGGRRRRGRQRMRWLDGITDKSWTQSGLCTSVQQRLQVPGPIAPEFVFCLHSHCSLLDQLGQHLVFWMLSFSQLFHSPLSLSSEAF